MKDAFEARKRSLVQSAQDLGHHLMHFRHVHVREGRVAATTCRHCGGVLRVDSRDSTLSATRAGDALSFACR